MRYMCWILLLCIIPFQATSRVLDPEQDPDITPFLRPIELTTEGITHFWACYNDPFYSMVLPRSSINLMDLLTYLKGQDDPHSFGYTILELFHLKWKECRWHNATALAQLLDQLPVLIGDLFAKKRDEKELLNNYLHERFYGPHGPQDLSIPARDLKEFLAQLTDDMYEKVFRPALTAHELGQLVVRFLESITEKVIWNAQDGIRSWKTFKLIGYQLEKLYEGGIVPTLDILNHVIWSLVHRYCYFIELSGSALPLACYIEMQKELEEGGADFLNYEDNDKNIRPKREVLTKALLAGQAKSLAYTKNILTDAVI